MVQQPSFGKVNGRTYKCKIDVYKGAKVNINKTRNMKFAGTNQPITYKSSNTNIATIDKNGKITPRRLGIITITAQRGTYQTYKFIVQVFAQGWVSDTKGNKYYYKDNKPLKGWHYIGKYKYYFSKTSGKLIENVDKILGKQKSYYIHVNRNQCKITIFAKNSQNKYVIPVMAMTCSVGRSETPTPRGTYSTQLKKRWGLLMGPSYGQYCTKVVGGIYIHSVAGYNKTSYNLSAYDYNRLGQPASHGCIRLCVRDAKWIYDNCKIGTTVTIDTQDDGVKFKKPSLPKIKSSQNYDPTDPNIKKK